MWWHTEAAVQPYQKRKSLSSCPLHKESTTVTLRYNYNLTVDCDGTTITSKNILTIQLSHHSI